MNILEQSKNEEFVKEQFIKGRILDDTKDYGRTQFVDEIYKLQQENKQLKDNWNELRKWIVYNKHNENTEQHYLVVDYGTLLGKMQEIEQGSDSNEY